MLSLSLTALLGLAAAAYLFRGSLLGGSTADSATSKLAAGAYSAAEESGADDFVSKLKEQVSTQ